MTDAGARRSEPAPRAERWTAAAVLAASLALRVLYAARASFDTDEPQHLHVAWLWGRGYVGYRDFFDNHTPLFHWLAIPLVRAVGERPELLYAARYALLPIVAAVLFATYRLAVVLFSRRVALWTIAVLAVFPSFFFDSIEFRPDVPWAGAWLAALASLRPSPRPIRRGLAFGFWIGIAFAFSVKTIFLVPTFVAAAVLVALLDRRDPLDLGVGGCAAAVAACVAVLAALAATLHALGALGAACDAVLAHNFASASLWSERLLRVLMFAITTPLLLLVTRRLLARAPENARLRAVLLLATGLYYTTLNAFVPLAPPQTFLPFYPAAVLLACGLGLAALASRPDWSARGPLVLTAVAFAEVVIVLVASPPFRDRTRFERGLVADILRITEPGDTVMDLKGETLFRRRPVRVVLERVTMELIQRGEIADDIAERMIAAGTYVTVVDSPRFPPAARRFLVDNYVPVGRLRVAGKVLAADSDGMTEFDVVVPGRYAIVSPLGGADGVLDDEPFERSRRLAAGRHRFRARDRSLPLALVWADAFEKGYSPFHPVLDR